MAALAGVLGVPTELRHWSATASLMLPFALLPRVLTIGIGIPLLLKRTGERTVGHHRFPGLLTLCQLAMVGPCVGHLRRALERRPRF